jgi:excisionase family DNA binding protein
MIGPRLSEAAVTGQRLTIDDIRNRGTISVPEAGQVLNIGRDAAYAAAARGELPVLRLGRTLRCPVPKLLEMLGVTPTQAASAGAAIPTLSLLKPADTESKVQSHGSDSVA